MKKTRFARNSSGQALIELAIMMPLLLTLVLNAVNFAFFFLMALDTTSASRTSGIYSIMGNATPVAAALPVAGPPTFGTTTCTGATVSDLACQDLSGSVSNPSSSNSGFNVCSSTIGVSGSGTATKTKCTKYDVGSGLPTTADSDPEAPSFLLGRVDVAYKFTPPIPFTVFNVFALATPNCSTTGGTVSCTFYRHVEMREMQ
jgi:hypothetical protein